MRKWTYLVATLLMAGTTTTFTGCIDTDEPDGIAELRGAKSELIKAQAAVEQVEVEMKKALVANQELMNKAQELANQNAEYDNQLKALDVKLKELAVELQQAKNEAEKAKLEAEIAKSNADKAAIENSMALAAEQFKADMLRAQERTAMAQQYYDEAMRALEASKLVLTDEEKAIINKAQLFMQEAATTMNSKYMALRTAQDNYYDALINPNVPSLAGLQADLKKAQIDVEKAEILLDEKNNMLALAEDFDAAAWDAKIKELDKQISEYESEQSKALYKVEETKASPAYKAAEEKVAEKSKAKTEAERAYNKVQNDSVAQTTTLRDIKEYKSEPINAALKDLFKNSSDFTTLSGYNFAAGVFYYNVAQYTQQQYDADLKLEDETARTSQAFARLRTVNAWVEALNKYTVNEDGVEWDKLTLAGKEESAKKAKENFDKLKANWEISAKAVKGTATPVPTTDLKKVTDAYNTSYTALTTAVNAYNTAYDKTYKAAYDKYITETKKAKEDEFYISGLEVLLARESTVAKGEYDTWSVGKTPSEKIAKLEGYLKNFDKTADIAGAKATATTKTSEFYAIAANLTALQNQADIKGQAALANSTEVKDALKALNKANSEVQTASNKITPAISDYVNVAANPYGQVLANPVNLDELIGIGAFVGDEEDKDGNPTGHKKALRSDISNDEFTKLSETKLDNGVAKNALAINSDAVFGSVFTTQDGRLVEVTEAMARAYVKENNGVDLTAFGALGSMLLANDDVQLCKDMIAAADLIKPLEAQLKGVLANLEAEIKANTALMDPFIAKANETRVALKDAKTAEEQAEEEKDALTAADEADAQKFGDLISDYQGLKATAQQQIDNINNGVVTGSTVTVESVILYWKGEIAKQEQAVEKARQKVKAAETNIELFNKGEYTAAYELKKMQDDLATAQEAYDAAKSVYDFALAQVKSVIAALTK